VCQHLGQRGSAVAEAVAGQTGGGGGVVVGVRHPPMMHLHHRCVGLEDIGRSRTKQCAPTHTCTQSGNICPHRAAGDVCSTAASISAQPGLMAAASSGRSPNADAAVRVNSASICPASGRPASSGRKKGCLPNSSTNSTIPAAHTSAAAPSYAAPLKLCITSGGTNSAAPTCEQGAERRKRGRCKGCKGGSRHLVSVCLVCVYM
jgi:hypothetical protein